MSKGTGTTKTVGSNGMSATITNVVTNNPIEEQSNGDLGGYPSLKARDKAIETFANKEHYSVQSVKSSIEKIKYRYDNYDVNDKEALTVLRKYLKSGWGSLEGYMKNTPTVKVLGAKKMYSK